MQRGEPGQQPRCSFSVPCARGWCPEMHRECTRTREMQCNCKCMQLCTACHVTAAPQQCMRLPCFPPLGGRGVWWCMKALTQFRVHRCRTPGVGVLERASCKLQQCDVLTMCCIHIYYICKFSGGLPAPHTSKQLREPSAMQPCLHSGEGFAAYALYALLRCCPALGRVHNGPTLHRER